MPGKQAMSVFVIIVILEVEIERIGIRVLAEARQLARIALGGTPETLAAVDETRYPGHLQQIGRAHV